MVDLDQVLTGLVRRTEEGILKWSRTVEGSRFTTSVDTISILISIDSEGYRLDILDESGEVVESLQYADTTVEQDKKLERLFVLARRSAHNIDSTLEKLARGLEL